MTAWIIRNNKYNTYGVRFYPVNSNWKEQDVEDLGVDGIITLIEKL